MKFQSAYSLHPYVDSSELRGKGADNLVAGDVEVAGSNSVASTNNSIT